MSAVNHLSKLQEQIKIQQNYIIQLEQQNKHLLARLTQYEPFFTTNKHDIKNKTLSDIEFEQLLEEIDSSTAPTSPESPNSPDSGNSPESTITSSTSSSPTSAFKTNNDRDYTILSTPISWQDAETWIHQNTFEKFGRSKSVMARFIKDITQYQQYFASARDKILIFNFNCSPRMNEKTHKLEAILDESETSATKPFIFIENEYPYFFTSDIVHYLLFSRMGPLPPDQMNKIINDHVHTLPMRAHEYETLSWVNPASMQTIPDLWHAHVIIAPKESIQRSMSKIDIFDLHLNAELTLQDPNYEKNRLKKGWYSGSSTDSSVGTQLQKNTKFAATGINFTPMLHATDSAQLLKQHEVNTEYLHKFSEYPRLCWYDIISDLGKHHYFDRLRRNKQVQAQFDHDLAWARTVTDTTSPDAEQKEDLVQVFVQKNEYPFDAAPGIRQFVVYTTHGSGWSDSVETKQEYEQIINQKVVNFCRLEGLHPLQQEEIPSQEQLLQVKKMFEKDDAYVPFSLQLVRVPTCLQATLVGPPPLVYRASGSGKGKLLRKLGNADTRLLFVCDWKEYYSFFSYKVYNLRFGSGFTWDAETCVYANVDDAGSFARYERCGRVTNTTYKLIKDKYASVRDAVLCREYQCKHVLVENAGKTQLKAIEDSSTPNFTVSDNIFPYSLLPGVRHYVIWCRGRALSRTQADELVTHLVRDRFGLKVSAQGKMHDAVPVDCVWWENPLHLRSIPDLSHIHVLIRNKQLYDFPIKSGYCDYNAPVSTPLKRYSWQALTDMIVIDDVTHGHSCGKRLLRDERCLREYYHHMRQRLDVYSDLVDVVLVHGLKLSLDCLQRVEMDSEQKFKMRVDRKHINSDDELFRKACEVVQLDNEVCAMYCLRENEFPYFVESGIECFVMWIVLLSDDAKLHQKAKQESIVKCVGVRRIENMVGTEIQAKFGDKLDMAKECIWFENKSETKLTDGFDVLNYADNQNGYISYSRQSFFSIHCIHVMVKHIA